MVLWLIGMSASGKTTIGKKLYEKLKQSNQKWIFLDGDTFRNILGEDLGHTLEDRKKNAYRISRFCEFLSSQNINVLACVLSIFHDNQKYNKEHISDYKEVYIDVSFDTLVKRDNKELYKKALKGEIQNVVGVDIPFLPPYAPDLIVDNNSESPDFDTMTDLILNTFHIQTVGVYSYTTANLLRSPEKYQYSRMIGKSFFTLFENDRKNCIDFLEKRFRRMSQNSSVDTTLTLTPYLDNNNLVLKKFLIFLYLSAPEELNENQSTVEVLLKRFEVGKKLYLTYDTKEIRKSSSEFDELLNYPLFSLVLQKYYSLTSNTQEKLIFLNTILKVNDIISSTKSDYILGHEIYYAIKAINGELHITENYL